MKKKRYDLIIIGGGAAGLVASVAAGAFGAKTALIEKDRLGGECSWTGCVPSKTLISAANLAYRTGCQPDQVMEHVHQTVKKASKASKVKSLLDKYQVDIFFGVSSFKDNHTLEMENVILKAKKFILCTGSSALVPSIQGLTKGYLTNQEIWELRSPPKSLLIIGGGPIGTEMAQAFHRLGSKVTIVDALERLLPRDDTELSTELTELLKKEGIDIHLNLMVKKISKTEKGWQIKDNHKTLFGEQLLIALGRKANTSGLNLEAAGISYDRDQIKVDKYLRTTTANIWAAGDCTGGYRFSHTAEVEAKTAVRNALFPFNSRPDYQGAPWATFTEPELAHLGLTEQECKEKNLHYRVYYQPFSGDDRAITEGTTEGKVKILATPLGKILGLHILGPRAGELMNEFVLAYRKKMRLSEIGLTIHVYPTLGMALQRATDQWFSDWAEKPWAKLLFKIFRG